jgi:RNA polymerase sigma factor (sigma-70 family)
MGNLKNIRVLLVDDHTILREGLRTILNTQPHIKVIAEAEDGRSAVELACGLEPDIVLMDISLPLLNGLEATRQIKKYHPEIQVIILTMHENEEFIRNALSLGAMGYILKDADSNEIINAIQDVKNGEPVLSPAVTRLVAADYLRWGDIRKEESMDGLSPREREVLQLIAEGYTNKEIAEILCISIKTVQAHRYNLMGKLDLHDRGELIKYAIQKKIIEI